MKKVHYIAGVLVIVFFALQYLHVDKNVLETGNIAKDENVAVADTLADEKDVQVVKSVDIPVLVYHNIREYLPTDTGVDRDYVVPPADFEKQMAYLKSEGYQTVLPKDIDNILNGDTVLPSKPVIISLDDGRDFHYETALPILEEYGLKAVFYIFTNAIDVNDRYLTSEQIRGLDAAGHEIASHTILHPYLTKEDDERLKKEVTESKAKLEKIIGHEVESFAYPFGLYADREIAAVADAGYTNARSLEHSYTISNDNILHIPGYITTSSFDQFLKILEISE